MTGDGRTLEGIVDPYGVAVELRPGVREVFRPGAFAEDVAAWRARSDGARVPFVTSHPGEGSRVVIGTVEELTETPQGLRFRARLVDTPAAREYAELVRVGANGVSVEFATPTPSRIGRDGLMAHSAARLLAIAGAVAPAYDSARVAVRSRRAQDMTEPRPEDEPRRTDDEETETVETERETTTETDREVVTTEDVPQARSRMSAVAGRVAVTEPERRSREAAAVARIGGAPARVTRSELVYTREGEHRFLRDGLRAAGGDMEAMGRLGRHYAILEDVARRAVTVSTDIPGTYVPEYLPGLLTPRIAQGRPAGSFFRRIPITDARARTFPRVTESTTVSKQPSEGVNPPVTTFKTEGVVATPDMYAGIVDVSRQVIDGGDPDAERMILDDLEESYMQVSEAAIIDAIEAGATQGAAGLVDSSPHDGLVSGIVTYQVDRFLPAEGAFAPAAVYEGLLLEQDDIGRPMVPYYGPSNAQGAVTGAGAAASVLGVPVYLSWASDPSLVVIARRDDAIYYESSIATFRYEQVAGPAAIRIGLWAYLKAAIRRQVGVVKLPVTPGTTELASGRARRGLGTGETRDKGADLTTSERERAERKRT